ncbi:toxic anion resistance protein [Virgibacillus profundi]|uniref:Toxic anion resistance protein n=1 Tax=Virgibacillus profundi TaxID=2024555 RepID=A0A2A2II51_9BACI|nr:toxic anion resistance protein [Virgibacillus profundi]PAV30830.1 toxic anion resistance protein [Virgibacillus profundi]PXY55013.1 toxic anion resistance protein [Virgibacillus profundi]
MNEQNESKRSENIDDLLANPFGKNDFTEQSSELHDSEDKPKRVIDTLPEASRQKAVQLVNQIDPGDDGSIISYGTEAQAKLLDFSHHMLDHVQNKDVGEIGDILKDLMKKLEQVNPEELQPEKRGLFSRMFGKISGSVNEILSKYQKTGAQIDRISVKLDRSKNALQKDNGMLNKMFDKNRDYYEALNIYIAAGEVKLQELEKKDVPKLKQKAELSQNQMDFQEVNDLLQFAERLEKRTHDLKLSRQITMQSAPQIRLIQNTNQALVEKIQASILTAIPLWKNQIAIALTLLRQRNAVEAQKQVSKTTNDLLLKNAEMLKANTIETAKENERGLVDIETLKKTQENLVSTIEETLRIQTEGREKRHQAERELIGMEDELKQKMLELK